MNLCGTLTACQLPPFPLPAPAQITPGLLCRHWNLGVCHQSKRQVRAKVAHEFMVVMPVKWLGDGCEGCNCLKFELNFCICMTPDELHRLQKSGLPCAQMLLRPTLHAVLAPLPRSPKKAGDLNLPCLPMLICLQACAGIT